MTVRQTSTYCTLSDRVVTLVRCGRPSGGLRSLLVRNDAALRAIGLGEGLSPGRNPLRGYEASGLGSYGSPRRGQP